MRKITAALLSVMITASLITGCGIIPGFFPSAQELAMEAADKVESISSVKMNEKLGFTGNIGASGTNVDMSMDMDITTETIKDPLASHISGKTKLSTLGETEESAYEAYVVKEDGKTVVYSSADGSAFEREELDQDQAILANEEAGSKFLDALASGTTEGRVRNKYEVINEEDTYAIDVEISGDAIKDALSGALNSSNSLIDSDVDFSTMKADAVIYIYKDSKLPAGFYMDCKGLGEEMIKQSLGQNADAYDIRIDDFEVNIVFYDYNTNEEIVVPESVKKEASANSFDLGSIAEEILGETAESIFEDGAITENLELK